MLHWVNRCCGSGLIVSDVSLANLIHNQDIDNNEERQALGVDQVPINNFFNILTWELDLDLTIFSQTL